MSSKLKSILFYSLTLIAGAILILLLISNIDPKDKDGQSISFGVFIYQFFKDANLFYLFLSAITLLLAHLIRSARWILVLTPIGYPVKLGHSFIAVMTSYFINLIIPRGGEVARAISIHKLSRSVPIETAVGTIVAERVVDLLLLLLCISSVFFIQYDAIMSFFDSLEAKSSSGKSALLLWGGIVLLFIVAGIAFIYFFKKTFFIKIKQKVITITKGLKTGLVAIFKLKKAFLFIFYSILIWVLYYLMFYFIVRAIPITSDLDHMAIMTIFTIGGIAMAMPVPSGAGSFHFFVASSMLYLYGHQSQYAQEIMQSNSALTNSDFLNEATSFGFATISHAWQTFIILIFGAYCLLLSRYISKKHTTNEN